MTLAEAADRLRRAGLLATDAIADDGGSDAADLRLSIVGEPWAAIRPILAEEGFAEIGRAGSTGREFAAYDVEADRWLRLRLAPVGLEAAARRRPTPPLRGLSVAVLGPDGAGKSTLTAALAATFILPTRQFYAGLYPAGRRRFRQPGLATLAILIRLWRLALQATWHRRRGRLVLFDRYAYDARLPLPRSAGRRTRLRRALLTRSLPAPDLVVVLDAPAEVLVARRAEHPIEVVEAQRRRYRELALSLPDAVVLDAALEAETVRRNLTELVWERIVARRGGSGGVVQP